VHLAKDSGVPLELAHNLSLDLPLARGTKERYDRMIAEGPGDLDKSRIAELMFQESSQIIWQLPLADSFLVFSIRLFELKDHILAARESLRSHRHPCRAARGAFSAAIWVQITIGQIPANNSPSAAAG
jgi:hypothetical protein